MRDERPHLYFDFVDPGSLLMHRRLVALDAPCVLVGFELRPPPEPLVEPGDPAWRSYWNQLAPALERAEIQLGSPRLIPRTRKAHELVLHAGTRGLGLPVRDRVWRAFVEAGVDIGRIDLLLGIAVEVGLDPTETKAVLDVDRWRDEVEQIRVEALKVGVRGVPTLVHRGRRLEGVHDPETIRAYLEDSGFR